jgi:hypothetical protein
LVQLNLDQVPAAVPDVNSAPRIQMLTATALDVQPTDVITFGVTAVDPDGESLTYDWSSADGSFEWADRDVARWVSPRREGIYPVKVRVLDSRGLAATAEFKVHVLTTLQEGRAEITAAINTFPVVSDVFVQPAPITVGEPVSLGVTASDADGDALIYAWTSSCEGSFDATDIDLPTFTLSALPESGGCTFKVVVDDSRGGSNYGQADAAAGENPEVVLGNPAGGIALGAPGVAFTYEGSCSGWNGCVDAATCAQLACTTSGYSRALSYGRAGFVTEFQTVNEIYYGYYYYYSYYYDYRYQVRYNWSPGDKSWCGGRMAVSDVVCH